MGARKRITDKLKNNEDREKAGLKPLGRPKNTEPKSYITRTIQCDKVLFDKMQAIAKQTDTPLRHIIDAAFRVALGNYEAKNGEIHKKSDMLDIDALFSSMQPLCIKK